jgi:hypothetical protein
MAAAKTCATRFTFMLDDRMLQTLVRFTTCVPAFEKQGTAQKGVEDTRVQKGNNLVCNYRTNECDSIRTITND